MFSLQLQITPQQQSEEVQAALPPSKTVQPYAPVVYGGSSGSRGNSEGKAPKAPLFGTVVFTPPGGEERGGEGVGACLDGTYLGDWDEKNKRPHGKSGTVRETELHANFVLLGDGYSTVATQLMNLDFSSLFFTSSPLLNNKYINKKDTLSFFRSPKHFILHSFHRSFTSV